MICTFNIFQSQILIRGFQLVHVLSVTEKYVEGLFFRWEKRKSITVQDSPGGTWHLVHDQTCSKSPWTWEELGFNWMKLGIKLAKSILWGSFPEDLGRMIWEIERFIKRFIDFPNLSEELSFQGCPVVSRKTPLPSSAPNDLIPRTEAVEARDGVWQPQTLHL